MYKVINFFTDGQDKDEQGNGYPYNVGDEYPRKGLKPSADRIRGLLGEKNGQGKPMIVEVKEVETAEIEPIEVEIPEKVEVPEKPKAKKPKVKKVTKK